LGLLGEDGEKIVGGGEEVLEKFILTLAVVRVLQSEIKAEFRNIKGEMQSRGAPSEMPYKDAIVKHFNKMFNFTKGSDAVEYWSGMNGLKKTMRERFKGCLTEEEEKEGVDLRDRIDMRLTFVYLNNILGGYLNPGFQISIWEDYDMNKDLKGQRVIFMSTDIEKVLERVRGMGVGKIFTAIKSFTLYKEMNKGVSALVDSDKMKAMKHLQYAKSALGETFTYVSTCVTANTWSSLTLLESAKECKGKFPEKREWYLVQAMTRLKVASCKEESKEILLILAGTLNELADVAKEKGDLKKAKGYKKEARACKKKSLEAKMGESWMRCQYVVSGKWEGLTEKSEPVVLEIDTYLFGGDSK